MAKYGFGDIDEEMGKSFLDYEIKLGQEESRKVEECLSP